MERACHVLAKIFLISLTRTINSNYNQVQQSAALQIRCPFSLKAQYPYQSKWVPLIEAASDCLLGLYFFETIRCDTLFSEGKLRIGRNSLVPFYWKQFSFDENQVYRKVALEKISIPPQHVLILSGTIPGWKALPIGKIDVFEPHEQFIKKEKEIAQDALFNFEKGLVPFTIANNDDDVLTIYKDTTFRSLQLVSDRLIQEVNRKQVEN